MKNPLHKNLNNEKGFTLIELLIVIAIIGVLAAIAVPQFNQYRSRGYGAATAGDLRNVYLQCKAFWGDSTPTTDCTNDAAGIQAALYGFIPSVDITVTIPAGAASQEVAFAATATHTGVAGVTWTVGPNGNITNNGGL